MTRLLVGFPHKTVPEFVAKLALTQKRHGLWTKGIGDEMLTCYGGEKREVWKADAVLQKAKRRERRLKSRERKLAIKRGHA